MIQLPVKITNKEVVFTVVLEELGGLVFSTSRSNEGLADAFDQTVVDALYEEFKDLAGRRLVELTPDTKIAYYDGEAKRALTEKEAQDAFDAVLPKEVPAEEIPVGVDVIKEG